MNQIDRAREIIRQTWEADSRPFYVCFSGGKDSTLLLQLVLEVRDASEKEKKVYAGFANTGYEMNGKTAQINKLRPQLKAVGVDFVEVKPPAEKKILVRIIGDGYPSPDWRVRYCTGENKERPQLEQEKELAQRYGGLLVLQGTRKEESANRARTLTREGAPLAKTFIHKRLNIEKFPPLSDVPTSELWEYLRKLATFKWGGTCDELERGFYAENKLRQRDGCWICTVARENPTRLKYCTDGQNIFRQYLRPIREDSTRRCLLLTDKHRKHLEMNREKGHASGRFTLTARREILDKLREAEKLDGVRYISDEELEIIRRKWEETREQFGES